jgi:hypothetical protein
MQVGLCAGSREKSSILLDRAPLPWYSYPCAGSPALFFIIRRNTGAQIRRKYVSSNYPSAY